MYRSAVITCGLGCIGLCNDQIILGPLSRPHFCHTLLGLCRPLSGTGVTTLGCFHAVTIIGKLSHHWMSDASIIIPEFEAALVVALWAPTLLTAVVIAQVRATDRAHRVPIGWEAPLV